jgi:hypothetical protein
VSPNRYALLIANTDYQDEGLRRLDAPAQDTEALQKLLADPGIGNFEVKVLVDRPHYIVQETIEDFFSSRKRDEMALLYISGHGLIDDEFHLYFATINTQRKRLLSTAVPAEFVNKLMTRSRSLEKVLLLDCCHSGAYGRGIGAKADSAIHTRTRFEGGGTVVLTASDERQYAFEGDTLTGQATFSFFTRALLDGLETGEADANKDGRVTFSELAEFVHDRVTAEHPQQEPRYWTFDVRRDLVIARNPLVTSPDTADQYLSRPLPAAERQQPQMGPRLAFHILGGFLGGLMTSISVGVISYLIKSEAGLLIGNIFLYGVVFAALLTLGVGFGMALVTRGKHFLLIGGTLAGVVVGRIFGWIDASESVLKSTAFGAFYGAVIATSIGVGIGAANRYLLRSRYLVWLLSGILAAVVSAALLILMFPGSQSVVPYIALLALGIVMGIGVTHNVLGGTFFPSQKHRYT